MLALGQRLRADGHAVVLGAPPGFRQDAASAGLEFHPIGQDAREYMQAHAADYVGGAARGAFALHRHLLAEVDVQFRAVPAAVAGCDLVLAAGLQVAAASIAEQLGIRYSYVAYCPALIESREHAPIMLPLPGMPRWFNRPAWRALRFAYQRTLRPHINRHRRALGLAPVSDLYHHLLTRRPLLATDVELAPVPPDSNPWPIQTGYLHPEEPAGAALPDALERFLATGPPPVYVGFGSMSCADPQRTTRAIIRALHGAGQRGVISHGWARLAEDALPATICAAGDVSHAALFPRMAAVVHHGGAGTTATAARAGVPQLIVPHIADQFFWGRRVAAVGIGDAPWARKDLDAERLGSAISRLVANHGARHRAAELGTRLRRRRPAVEAVAALEHLCP